MQHLYILFQVLLTELAEAWPARSTWTTEPLLQNYGDTIFRISQRSPKKILMKFKDYVSYMKCQHDEDPLYIFDDKVPLPPVLLSIVSVSPGFYTFWNFGNCCSSGKLHQDCWKIIAYLIYFEKTFSMSWMKISGHLLDG